MNPNTVIIGLLQLDNRAACLVKLCQYSGNLIPVADHVGADALQVLSEVLHDIKLVKARYALLFSNIPLDTNRMNYKFSPEKWLRRGKMWFLQFDEKELDRYQRDNALKFIIMRQLFQFDKWQYTIVPAEQLSGTRRLLDDYQ